MTCINQMKQNHSGLMAKEKFTSFREVPNTGVIYVMSEAQKRGFAYGNQDWCNLGQGAPETACIDAQPKRLESIAIDEHSSEYSNVAGHWELREAVANLYNTRFRRGMKSQYSAENVAISSGGRQGLTRIAASMGNINLGHFLPDYTAYEELLDLFRSFVPIPIVLDPNEGFLLTADRVGDEIVGKGLGAIILSNPANPTGRNVRGETLQQICYYGHKYQCALIFDEFYSHYQLGREDFSLSSAAMYIEEIEKTPVLVVDGLTKNWRYPGLRISWTLGPKEIIQKISSSGSFLDGGAPHPVQKAIVPLLDVEHANQEARSIQAAFNYKRDFMIKRLNEMGISMPYAPEGGFYFFPSLVKLPESINNGRKLFEKLLEQKVISVPGSFFDVDPGHRREHIPSRLEHYIRLSFGPPMRELELGLQRLQSVIDQA